MAPKTTNYNAGTHSPLLHNLGLWEKFQAARDRHLAAQKSAKDAGNLAFAEVMTDAVKGAAAPKSDLDAVAAALRAKGDAPIDACIEWAMEAIGLQRIGIPVDYSTAPSIKAVAIFSLAEADAEKVLSPYIKQAASKGTGGLGRNDDGGNLQVLDAFLQASAEGSGGERPVEEETPPEGDGDLEGGSQPST